MGKAKRALPSRLPKDWRQRIWQAAAKRNTKQRDAIATLELTGCRPKELENGIRVELETSAEWVQVLVFRVFGAKVDGVGDKYARGQPMRHLFVPLSSPAARYIAERITRTGPVQVVYHRRSISNRIGELGRSVFPRNKESISSYCYRHALASDLKDTVTDVNMKAWALGHLSDYSQARYGRPSRGKQGPKKTAPILDAVGTREVKHSPKTDRLLRFKIASKNRKMVV